MNVREAYNAWSATYDAVENKTRDLEARALRESVSAAEALDILEIGCGTGKMNRLTAMGRMARSTSDPGRPGRRLCVGCDSQSPG